MTRPLALVFATALLSAGSLRQSLSGGPPDAGFAAAVGLAIAVTLVASRATGGRGTAGSGALRWVGPALLALAAAIAVVDRRLVVSSHGSAPDEVMLAVLIVALPALALLRVPARVRESVAIGLALATYALVGVALIAGKPYHVDAVIAPHRAAELLLAGRDPYRDFDLLEAAARFRLDPALVTHFTDGTQVRVYDYPALSFLVVTPFVGAGLDDIRWLYLGELLILALVVARRASGGDRQLAVAAVVGNVVITRQYVLAGIDPSWVLLVVSAWLVLGRRWPSAILIGLAAAARQTAWFVVPFYLLAVLRREGARETLRRTAIAAAAALVPHAPFLLDAPVEVARGVLTPVLGALEPDGVGLVRFGLDGVLPLLPREAYLLLALGTYAAATLAFARPTTRPHGGAALAIAPLYLAWRSLQSYFAFVPLLALATDDEAPRPALRGTIRTLRGTEPLRGGPRAGDLVASGEQDTPEVSMAVPRELLEILACPVDRAPVREDGDRLVCGDCGRRYPVRDGIPVMLVEEAEVPAA